MSNELIAESELEKRLLATHLVNEEQLHVARQLRDETEVSLAQAITELDLLSASEMSEIIFSLKQIRKIKVEEVDVDREAVRHIPAAVALRYRLIPLRRSGNSLIVAMADPGDTAAMKALSSVTDHEILPFLADNDALEHALHLYYEGQFTDSSGGREGQIGAVHSAEDAWKCESPRPVTLDSLLECDANRQARNLAFQIAGDNKEMYSCPILLVGPPGCGKSHLLRAIGSYISAKYPMMRGLLMSGIELKHRVAEYALVGKTRLLRYELRDRQYVLLDRIGDLVGARAVENEFQGLIASCRAQSSWVVCTLTPDELISQAWSSETRKLLDSGLIVNMDIPDLRTRSEILSNFVEDRDMWKDKISELAQMPDLNSALQKLREFALISTPPAETTN